jgi:hypothetical protein
MRTVNVPAKLAPLLQPEVVPMIRLGNNHDGGYVAPVSALSGCIAVISLGMKDDWSFEQSITYLHRKALIHSYDPTVTLSTMFASIKLGIKSLLGFKDLTLWGRSKVICSYFSYFRGPYRRHFREWVRSASSPDDAIPIAEVFRRVADDARILLKIDIEGDEYGVLADVLNNGETSRIPAIFVEYHDLDERWDDFVILQTRLLERYHLVHVHANNINREVSDDGIPSVIEMTYLLRGIESPSGLRAELPIVGLDFPNDRHRPDWSIKFA